jgi:hypothetical protein
MTATITYTNGLTLPLDIENLGCRYAMSRYS